MNYLLVAEGRGKKPLYLLMVKNRQILLDVVKVLKSKAPEYDIQYKIHTIVSSEII